MIVLCVGDREHEQVVGRGGTEASLRKWHKSKVLDAMVDVLEVSHDVICLSNPAQWFCKSVRSMFADGAHFRLDDKEHVLHHVVDDSSYAVISPQANAGDAHSSALIRVVRRVEVLSEILDV